MQLTLDKYRDRPRKTMDPLSDVLSLLQSQSYGFCGLDARLRTIDAAEVRRLHDEGIGPAVIAKQLKIGRASICRLLGVEKNGKPEGVGVVLSPLEIAA